MDVSLNCRFIVDKERNRVLPIYNNVLQNAPQIDHPHPSPLGINLLDGYQNDATNYIDNHLNYFQQSFNLMYPNNMKLSDVVTQAEFLCTRGFLQRFIQSYYEDLYQEGFKFEFMKYKGVIFLKEKKTDYRINMQENMAVNLKKSIYGGLQFERQLIQRNRSNELYLMNRVVLQKNVLLICAETDAVSDNFNAVELKTKSRRTFWEMPNVMQHNYFKWYLQATLGGVNNILIGIHDNFIIQEYVRFNTADIANGFPSSWLTNSLTNADQFLHEIKTRLMTLPENIVFVAEKARHNEKFRVQSLHYESENNPFLLPEFKAKMWR